MLCYTLLRGVLACRLWLFEQGEPSQMTHNQVKEIVHALGGRYDDSHHRVTPSCPGEGTRQSSNTVRPQNDTGRSTASSNARDARFGRIAR